MKQYKLTGKFIDIELVFNTIEEAEKKLAEWLKEDKIQFPNEDTSDDYYITEEDDYMTEEVLNEILKQYSAYDMGAKMIETSSLFLSDELKIELIKYKTSCEVLLELLEPFGYTINSYNGTCELVKCY